VPRETIAKLEVSGEISVETRSRQILEAYRLLGEDVTEAETIEAAESIDNAGQ
jgi:hypothetical protein